MQTELNELATPLLRYMIEADNLSHLMNGHLIFSHQFLYGLVIVLRLEHVLLLVNMLL